MQIGISSVGDEKQLRNWKRHFGATWIIRTSLYTMWASGCGNGLLWINLIASLLLFSCNFAISSCSSSHRACGQNKITLKKTKGKKWRGLNFRFINCTSIVQSLINLAVLWNDPFLTHSYRTIFGPSVSPTSFSFLIKFLWYPSRKSNTTFSFEDYNCCILSLIPSRGCFIVQCCLALISSYCLYHLFFNFLLLRWPKLGRLNYTGKRTNCLTFLIGKNFDHLSIINFIYCDISLFVILVLFSPLSLLFFFSYINVFYNYIWIVEWR